MLKGYKYTEYNNSNDVKQKYKWSPKYCHRQDHGIPLVSVNKASELVKLPERKIVDIKPWKLGWMHLCKAPCTCKPCLQIQIGTQYIGHLQHINKWYVRVRLMYVIKMFWQHRHHSPHYLHYTMDLSRILYNKNVQKMPYFTKLLDNN